MMAPLLRPSLVSMATSMEITFDHSFCIRSFLLGVPPCQRHPQIPSFTQTSMPNLDPFFTSSFDHNFRTNDNQTFIVYAKSTLVLYRRGLCVFFSLGICPRIMWQSVASISDQRDSVCHVILRGFGATQEYVYMSVLFFWECPESRANYR